MQRHTFQIKYRNPTNDNLETVVHSFVDTPDISAQDAADDYGYTLADKGWYHITELPSVE